MGLFVCGDVLLGTRRQLAGRFESRRSKFALGFANITSPRCKFDRAHSRAIASAKMAAAYPGQARAVQILQDAPRPPQLIVFDLDYTLWPFWCEMYTVNDTPSLYPESRGILEACRELNISMAIASRTPTPKVAKAFMNKLGLSRMFDSVQLIPASSGYDHHSAQKDTDHFPAIQRETNIPYTEMIFFDDESPNISKVGRLGVTSVLVSSGMSVDILQKGLEQHAASWKSQSRK